jgi:catechol 2,3-dioxygenase-like lactoylglutathione lyase family enzyme
LRAFRWLYGEPTHIDGHHHVHVHPSVLSCLPQGLPIRPVIRPGNELDRRPTRRDAFVRENFRPADACVSFQHVHPSLGGIGLELLDFGRGNVLEVMVHPQSEPESEALHSSEWADALSRADVGSYRDLVGFGNSRPEAILGLDHVQLAAPPGCEQVARRFLGATLGLAELRKPAALNARGGVWFALGAQQLHVGVEDEFAPARKAHPALRVRRAQLDSMAQRLAATGAPVRWDEELAGVRRFYTEDPWGNRIELIEDR